MLSVSDMLFTLSVIMLNVVMLSVVVPESIVDGIEIVKIVVNVLDKMASKLGITLNCFFITVRMFVTNHRILNTIMEQSY